jgi:AmiR/NasT family two-component response regulator
MSAMQMPDRRDPAEDLRTALVEIIANGVLREDSFERALESRDVIGQAKGILMEREGVTADEAFEMLRSSSQHLNKKLRDIAAMVVASVPGTRPGSYSR